MSIKRWKHAVVNLEGATDENEVQARMRRISLFQKSVTTGLNSLEREELVSLSGFNERHNGTAIYLADQGKRYLLTARHVLHDPWAEKRAIDDLDEMRASLNLEVRPSPQSNLIRDFAKNEASVQTFRRIFLVPNLNNQSKFLECREIFLMNLPRQAYSFSSPELDIAVISLDTAHVRFGRFADTLDTLGYVPISLDDIADAPSEEGVEVFTVGYPSMLALGERNLSRAAVLWESALVSEPALSFGRISMLHTSLSSFWVDMSIAPGNSGGPVVENDHLVGIIQRQATENVMIINQAGQTASADDLKTYMPFASVSKSANLKPLIAMQQEKDSQNRDRFIGPHRGR